MRLEILTLLVLIIAVLVSSGCIGKTVSEDDNVALPYCVPNYYCGESSGCENGMQVTECVDTNECGKEFFIETEEEGPRLEYMRNVFAQFCLEQPSLCINRYAIIEKCGDVIDNTYEISRILSEICPEFDNAPMYEGSLFYHVLYSDIEKVYFDFDSYEIYFNGQGLPNAFCDKGDEPGENINYWYCSVLVNAVMIDKQGTILGEQGRAMYIVFNENREYLETKC